jgi:hypothetical protein
METGLKRVMMMADIFLSSIKNMHCEVCSFFPPAQAVPGMGWINGLSRAGPARPILLMETEIRAHGGLQLSEQRK